MEANIRQKNNNMSAFLKKEAEAAGFKTQEIYDKVLLIEDFISKVSFNQLLEKLSPLNVLFSQLKASYLNQENLYKLFQRLQQKIQETQAALVFNIYLFA